MQAVLQDGKYGTRTRYHWSFRRKNYAATDDSDAVGHAIEAAQIQTRCAFLKSLEIIAQLNSLIYFEARTTDQSQYRPLYGDSRLVFPQLMLPTLYDV